MRWPFLPATQWRTFPDEHIDSLKTPGAQNFVLRNIGGAYSAPGAFQNWLPSADGSFMAWETHAYWDTNFDLNASATITYEFNIPFAIERAYLGFNKGDAHLIEISAYGADWGPFGGGNFWSPTDISSIVHGSSAIWLRGTIVGYERFLHMWQDAKEFNFLLVANSAVVLEPRAFAMALVGVAGFRLFVRMKRR